MENWQNIDYHVLHGDSLLDVVQFLNSTPRKWRDDQARSRPGIGWTLGASWEDSVRMAREGWQEGLTNLVGALDVLMPPNDKETETRYDVAGYFPDVARYVAGDPAHMISRGRTHGHPPVVNIVISATASGGVSDEHYANFGAAMTNVIDRIEAGGRRVELHIVFPNALRSSIASIRCLAGWRVKAAEDHVDLAAIAFSIAHPAAYRRFGFGLWEHTEQRFYPGRGYGSCPDFVARDAEVMGLENAVIVNATGYEISNCSTPSAALAWVRDQINSAAGAEIVSTGS